MTARLILPHQLFEEHLDAPASTHMVLLEDDLFFRQFKFHKQKLILHRASMKRFEQRLDSAGFATSYIATCATQTSKTQLGEWLQAHNPKQCRMFDPVDDWAQQQMEKVCEEYGVELELLETPNFITTGKR